VRRKVAAKGLTWGQESVIVSFKNNELSSREFPARAVSRGFGVRWNKSSSKKKKNAGDHAVGSHSKPSLILSTALIAVVASAYGAHHPYVQL
jgi:hypothetical protein